MPSGDGNADAWLLTGEDSGREAATPERHRKLDAVRAWSLGQLTPEDRAFIATFQPTVTIQAGGRRLLCFHGSPGSFDDVILPTTPEDEFQRYLLAHADNFLTGGHTHIQHIRRLGDSIYFNPGSVGFAYRHGQDPDAFRADPWAEYAVLTLQGAGYALEFRRVPYDARTLMRVLRAERTPSRGGCDRAVQGPLTLGCYSHFRAPASRSARLIAPTSIQTRAHT